jgi:hypothetical protein
MTDIENEIFEVWKELNPNLAFIQGLEDYAGKLFIPTSENQEKVLKRIQELKSKTDDQVEKKFLESLDATLRYREAPHDLSDIIWSLFGHLVKEGVNTPHISSLIDYSIESLENSMSTYKLEELPIIFKVILSNKCNALLGILKIITNETEDEKLKEKIKNMTDKIKKFQRMVIVEGLKKGGFKEVFPILKSHPKADLGRKDDYHQIIKALYDFYETPEEIEEKALSWLESELPKLNETAERLAKIYDLEMNIETIDIEITKQSSVDKSKLLEFIKYFREKAQKIFESRLVRITPNYKTDVIETPDYLQNLIPTAAMTTFDGLVDNPFNIIFVTTDDKYSPPTSIPDLFQLVVHEEYGHCINFSNSSLGFAAQSQLIEKLESTLHYPISEGISFHRELESLQLLEELVAKPKEELLQEELELLNALTSQGDIKIVLLESKFVVLKWRIIRFLRAIGDVRINLNKQSIPEFVEWAANKTGFSEKTIFDQIFIFQDKPGYAPCYSIAGMALKEIQDDARKKGKDILEFNTIASSLGFPPRTVFEERLRNL